MAGTSNGDSRSIEVNFAAMKRHVFFRIQVLLVLLALGATAYADVAPTNAPATCRECHGTRECAACKATGKTRCNRCNGSGKTESSCGSCGGNGRVSKTTRTGGKTRRTSSLCSSCGGRGKKSQNCSSCGGDGKVTCRDCSGNKTCSRCQPKK